MSASIYKYKNELEHVAKKWFETLEHNNPDHDRLVQKGLLLFRQHSVRSFSIENNKLVGVVQDTVPMVVEVNLKFLEMSSCICSAHYYCRHQLALFFRAYNEIGNVTNLIDSWKMPANFNDIKKQFGITTARDLLNNSTNDDFEFEHWIKVINDQFNDDLVNILEAENTFLLEREFSSLMLNLKINVPKRRIWWNLYKIVFAVVTFKKTIPYFGRLDYSNNSCLLIFKKMREIVAENASEINIHFAPFSFDLYVEKLIFEVQNLPKVDDIFDELSINDQIIITREISHFYALLWEMLFKKTSWRNDEKRHLEYLISAENNISQKFLYSICYANILFLDKQDIKVLDVIKNLDLLVLEYTLDWTKKLLVHRSWQRIPPYINFIIKNCAHFIDVYPNEDNIDNFVKNITLIVHNYCRQINDFSFYEKVIVDLFPYTFEMCEEYFFYKADYEKWTELIIFEQINVTDINDEKLMAVKEQNPRLLLPIYHQSVSHYISLRTRNNYRQAVRLLKQLREIYLQLNKNETWKVYLQLLLEKTSRLRAFQEECSHGGLSD